VTIRPADYVGRDLAVARGALEALGMKVKVKRVNRPRVPKNRVVGIEPSGSVVQGSTVTLVVADKRSGG
jgi:beta-lactam-binding protein with PASTA domain